MKRLDNYVNMLMGGRMKKKDIVLNAKIINDLGDEFIINNIDDIDPSNIKYNLTRSVDKTELKNVTQANLTMYYSLAPRFSLGSTVKSKSGDTLFTVSKIRTSESQYIYDLASLGTLTPIIIGAKEDDYDLINENN